MNIRKNQLVICSSMICKYSPIRQPIKVYALVVVAAWFFAFLISAGYANAQSTEAMSLSELQAAATDAIREGEYEQAIGLYNAILAVIPDDQLALDGVGYCKSMIERIETENAKAAEEKNRPKKLEYLDAMIRESLKTMDIDTALSYLAQVLEVDPVYYDYSNVAVELSERMRTSEAKQWLSVIREHHGVEDASRRYIDEKLTKVVELLATNPEAGRGLMGRLVAFNLGDSNNKEDAAIKGLVVAINWNQLVRDNIGHVHERRYTDLSLGFIEDVLQRYNLEEVSPAVIWADYEELEREVRQFDLGGSGDSYRGCTLDAGGATSFRTNTRGCDNVTADLMIFERNKELVCWCSKSSAADLLILDPESSEIKKIKDHTIILRMSVPYEAVCSNPYGSWSPKYVRKFKEVKIFFRESQDLEDALAVMRRIGW